ALALGRMAVKIGKGGDMNQLALGMAEYRSGNHTAAAEALRAASKAGPKNIYATGISGFFEAMILFRQGKHDEARQLATTAAGVMKPLPRDENNPLTTGVGHDDLILWLAYKEARALFRFDLPSPPVPTGAKN